MEIRDKGAYCAALSTTVRPLGKLKEHPGEVREVFEGGCLAVKSHLEAMKHG